MPRVFVGNFEFEHELIWGQRELTREAKTMAADLVSAWVAVANADDVIWSPTGPPAFDFRDLQALGLILPRFVSSESQLPRGAEWELVPWGWTPQLVAWGQRRGWSFPAPPTDVVRLVNSRVFRWQLEVELGIALPGSVAVCSVDELVSHISEHALPHAGWVLKANYGMSGRERFLGRGNQLDEPVRNWARKRMESGGGIVYEPWLERIAEAGLQWNIPRSGNPELVGVTPLLTDPSGTYRGSCVLATGSELQPLFEDSKSRSQESTASVTGVSVHPWQSAIDASRQVVQRVQQQGYWGPVGIDAMQYLGPDGQILCRPLQDLNARHTMGRLALGLRPLIPAGYMADWLHDAQWLTEAVANEPAAKVVQTTARSWLVMRPEL